MGISKGNETGGKNRGEDMRIYRPKNKVIPEFEENVIVDNYTDGNGFVFNRSEENVLLSKKEVDENHK